jgi:chromosome partitioning protein
MRRVAILSLKGGTGKTTTAVNLSHALTLKRQNVLVVDCDPQDRVVNDWEPSQNIPIEIGK